MNYKFIFLIVFLFDVLAFEKISASLSPVKFETDSEKKKAEIRFAEDNLLHELWIRRGKVSKLFTQLKEPLGQLEKATGRIYDDLEPERDIVTDETKTLYNQVENLVETIENLSSNTEDLLPCLLGMYDSIAAARKLRETEDAIDDRENVAFGENIGENVINSLADHVIDNEADGGPKMAFAVDNRWSGCRSPPSECSPANAPAADLWCHFRDLSEDKKCPKSSNTFVDDRPASPVSIASMSSRCSVCSRGSCSEGSVDDADNEESNGRCAEEDSANPADESAESLVSEDGNRVKNAKSSTVQQRTSYTTASQYSEDSGIYSNLIRSESLHERSWCCSDGDDFTYTNRVILEILETELVYVNDLHQIITGYLDEWRNDGNCTLSREQIHDLFNNIEEIYNFNRCFLWELEQCGLDPVKIARCFVENNANFSIYAAYCTNYPRSISILTELMRQERTAHLFRERQIRLHHTLPLGSYLLKPVQRILKYHLLLQNMVKHTPPDVVGYNDITVALSTMTGIAHHINTMKRRHEHAVRVQEVQSLLTGWQGPDLTTFGELYAEGSFRISGAKAFRHIFLFEHMLLVTKKKEAGILNYKTHILCSNLMLVECIPKEPLSFQIIPFDNPRLQFSIHARSLEEKRHWTLELKRVILENYNVNIPSHARQLVMELGQVQHSDNVSVEKISSAKRQLSTPEYLERRKADREKKGTMKSRLLPLFRKSDSLQNRKMQSKLRKNRFLSEGSIFSDTSANSDESFSNDEGLQNLSKTTEDLSQTCDEMTRTLADLSKSSVCSSLISTPSRNSAPSVDDAVAAEAAADVNDKERRNSYQQKEKLIEEIIGQLLIASQKFQKAIKEHEISVRAKQQQQQQSSIHRRYSVSDCSLPEERHQNGHYDSDEELGGANLLMYAKEGVCAGTSVGGKDASALDTSSESLSASLNVLVPTPPTVWLKQQAQHLASPHKKADSLPRTFHASATTEEEWRANRPKTIASDKPTQLKGAGAADANECCEMRINAFRALRNKKESTVSVASSLNSTSMTSAVATAVHPESRFYRTSVTRMTLKRMMRSLSVKLLSRRGKNERFYKVAQHISRQPEKYVRTEEVDCAIFTVNNCDLGSDVGVTQRLLYRQGSADLGARIANGKEVPDYADPKVLFPTITPSKKAAALLGIRAYPNVSASCANLDERIFTVQENCAENETVTQTSATCASESSRELRTESDCSADSFYERQFEQVESEFENAIRETSILSDGGNTPTVDEAIDVDDVRDSFRRYSQVSVNISVHKLIKIPPPAPARVASVAPSSTAPHRAIFEAPRSNAPHGAICEAPRSTAPQRAICEAPRSTAPHGANCEALRSTAPQRAISTPKVRTSNSAATKSKRFVMASGESSIPTRGWVKQVVEKFQSSNDMD